MLLVVDVLCCAGRTRCMCAGSGSRVAARSSGHRGGAIRRVTLTRCLLLLCLWLCTHHTLYCTPLQVHLLPLWLQVLLSALLHRAHRDALPQVYGVTTTTFCLTLDAIWSFLIPPPTASTPRRSPAAHNSTTPRHASCVVCTASDLCTCVCTSPSFVFVHTPPPGGAL